MTSQSIEVHYEATAKDYRRVLFWYQWKRLLLVAIAYLLVVSSIVLVLGYGAGGQTGSNGGFAPTVAFIFLFMLPLLIGTSGYLGIWRQARRTAANTEPATATFRDIGMKIETPSSTTERIWAAFSKVYETGSDLIFFPFENVFYTIPKRYFRNETELGQVRDLLRAGLGKKAKLIG